VDLVRTVQREGGVVLLSDVTGVLDPEAVYDVALDVQAQDVAGVGAHLVLARGELDAAALPRPPTLTWALMTTGKPTRAATSSASSTVSATPPGETGMPNREKYCFP